MTRDPPRVVSDCNVYLQALISRTGPAAACVEEAIHERVRLYWCESILAELRRLPQHAELADRGVTPERVEALIEKMSSSL